MNVPVIFIECFSFLNIYTLIHICKTNKTPLSQPAALLQIRLERRQQVSVLHVDLLIFRLEQA